MNILEVPEESSQAILENLRATGLFRYVERDYYAHTGLTPNDSSYLSQWYLPVIQAPQAWDITTGSGSVLIAVIDSGVDATNPDLASKVIPGWSFINNSADTTDLLGHGTAVAATAAAASNNNSGTAGVSWGSMILPVAVVDSSDFATYSNIALGIRYAADHGAQIINISLGGSNSSTALQSAVDYAWGKGAAIFAAAMNAGSSAPYYPAACNHVVAVNATDSAEQLANFSNYGDWVTLSAPGTSILAPMKGGGYGYWYGTSFSSPIAAGIAALALSANPTLANSALVDLLKQNTDDLGAPGFDSSFGWGRVNAYRTVLATGAKPVTISVTVSPASATLTQSQTQQFTATVTGSTAGVTWSLSPAAGSVSASGLYTAPASITAAQTVTVMATSAGDPTKSASAVVRLQPPSAPVATVSIAPSSATLGASQSVQFTATVSGATGAVAWSLNPAAGAISSTGLYTAPSNIDTNQTVTVTASIAGASATATVYLQSASSSARVNAGGPAYTDSLGRAWSADRAYNGGSAESTTQSISNTSAPALYQTARTGTFTYDFAVPNGNYQVTLSFAETSQLAIGKRRFNVAVNGSPVLSNFDIYSQAGGGFIALDKTFRVKAAGGRITIAFTPGASGLPVVSAIQIAPAGNGKASSSYTGGSPLNRSFGRLPRIR